MNCWLARTRSILLPCRPSGRGKRSDHTLNSIPGECQQRHKDRPTAGVHNMYLPHVFVLLRYAAAAGAPLGQSRPQQYYSRSSTTCTTRVAPRTTPVSLGQSRPQQYYRSTTTCTTRVAPRTTPVSLTDWPLLWCTMGRDWVEIKKKA